jgi:hypothetical protein
LIYETNNELELAHEVYDKLLKIDEENIPALFRKGVL